MVKSKVIIKITIKLLWNPYILPSANSFINSQYNVKMVETFQVHNLQTLFMIYSTFPWLIILNKPLFAGSIKAKILNQPVKIQDNRASNIFG